jgi:hypothetical protein
MRTKTPKGLIKTFPSRTMAIPDARDPAPTTLNLIKQSYEEARRSLATDGQGATLRSLVLLY